MAVAERLGAPIIKAVLAVLAGGFITAGGLFSVLLGTGIEPAGAQRLIECLAFSAGFFFVVLSAAVLFTEAKVVLPASSTAPANMGCLALHVAHSGDGSWAQSLLWNILPAGLGNIVGAATLVAIPCWGVFNRSSSAPEAMTRWNPAEATRVR